MRSAITDFGQRSAVAVASQRPPLSAQCYATTRWQRLLYERRAEGGRLADGVHAVSASQARPGDELEQVAEAQADADAFGGEVFARLYDDPPKLDGAAGNPACPRWAPPAHDLCDGLPEWTELREAVGGDPDFAALAAGDVLRGIAPKLAELAEQQREREERVGQPDDGLPTAGDLARAAVRRVLAEARERTDAAREALNGLAPGLGTCPPTHRQEDPARMRLAERIRDDKRLRDVLRRAGRLRRISAKRAETKSTHARSEVVDLERGADLARVLPSQLAGLRHPRLRLLALRGLLERSLLQYRLAGTEPLGRGPIVVLLDESGSMSGDGQTWASAVGIACLQQAARDHRRCVVAGFDTQVRSAVRLDVDGHAYLREHRQPTWTRIQAHTSPLVSAVLHVASRNSGGGTSFDPAIECALAEGVVEDRADLVLVTDGEAEASPERLDQLREAKSRGLRVFAVTVQHGRLTAGLAALADEHVHLSDSADKGAAAAACVPA